MVHARAVASVLLFKMEIRAAPVGPRRCIGILPSTCLSPCGRFPQEAQTLMAESLCSAVSAHLALDSASFRICLSVLSSLLLPTLPSRFFPSSTLLAAVSLPPCSLVSSGVRMPKPQRPLRVSSNLCGKQKGIYFLQLPYRFAIPLLGFSVPLHGPVLPECIFSQGRLIR